MKIYEISNGWIAESFVRVYVCAENYERALELAEQKFRDEGRKVPNYNRPSFWRNLRIEAARDCDTEWVSVPSGDGLALGV